MIKILAIEGVNGVGKTTLTKLLSNYFTRNLKPIDCKVVTHRFPSYETEIGQQIRGMLKISDLTNRTVCRELVRLMIEDRHQWWVENYSNLIETKNALIIFDRYRMSNFFCSAPYFMENENDLEGLKNTIKWMNELEIGAYRVPQEGLDIILTVDDLGIVLDRLAKQSDKHQHETKEAIIRQDELMYHAIKYDTKSFYTSILFADATQYNKDYDPKDHNGDEDPKLASLAFQTLKHLGFSDDDIRKVSPYFETLLNDFWMMLRRDEYEKSKIFPR